MNHLEPVLEQQMAGLEQQMAQQMLGPATAYMHVQEQHVLAGEQHQVVAAAVVPRLVVAPFVVVVEVPQLVVVSSRLVRSFRFVRDD